MEPAVFEIKPATKEDLPTVYDLICELADYEKLRHVVVSSPEDLEKWAFGEEKVITIFCGWVNGVIGGFTLHFLNYSTFLGRPGLYLEDLYMRPQYRGAGYGKKMLLHLCKIAKTRGYGRMDWQVLDWNKPSIDFYQSLGAKPMSDWITYRLASDQITVLANQFDATY
eukprot:gene2561-2936_t